MNDVEDKLVFYTSPQVELIGVYGGDLTAAVSAWTSTNHELTEDKKERVEELIWRLILSGHHTPFEKILLHFRVLVDDKTHIHLLKHRMASINGESARYKEYETFKCYVPPDLEPIVQDYLVSEYIKAFKSYVDVKRSTKEYLIQQGMDKLAANRRAKEASRFLLLQGTMIYLDISFNMRSFMNFINLRMDVHAQKEIQIVAEQMWNLANSKEELLYTMDAVHQYLLLQKKLYNESQLLLGDELSRMKLNKAAMIKELNVNKD